MAGFAAPGILFLNSWNEVERRFMLSVAKKLRERGGPAGPITRCVEPCAGAFAMSGVYVTAGFEPAMIETSDVGLFSAILGYALADKDHRELGVKLDTVSIPLVGDPVHDAAELLYEQALARMAARPRVHYWIELQRDLVERRSEHVEKIAYYVEQLRARFTPGLSYEPLDMIEHMRRVADDPGAVIMVNPPSYMGGYEKFFDTKGRLTWDAEPEYGIWNPTVHKQQVREESEDWDATLLFLELAAPGESVHPEPVYAHDKRRGACDYIWSNKTEELRELLGLQARQRNVGDHEKLDNPTIPLDYEPTMESEVGVRKLRSKETRYYKDLWVHRLDFGQAAGGELGVFIDGYLAGMAGFAHVPVMWGQQHQEQEKALLMIYAVGAPHSTLRLGRLVKMLALSRPVLETTMHPWFVVSADKVMTKNWSKHPEYKGNRGIFQLHERKPHPQFGFELTYFADIEDRSAREAFELWMTKEAEWREARTPKQPKQKQRRRRTTAPA